MALQRKEYENWDINAQADKVLSIAEQIKNAYKGSIWDPANTIVDVEKGFSPSHLFFTDKDLYYSDYTQFNPPYVYEFTDFDQRAPFRGFYKRTEVGLMFPEIVKSTDVPQPGSPIVWKRREPVSIWQDESAPLADIHFRNVVDFRIFEFTKHFLDANDYARVKNAVFDSMRKGNSLIEKLWVDTFIANILGLWSYPVGDVLFRFFTGNDDYVPEQNYSKVARGFYLKDGEIRKGLIELGKYVRKYYLNRVPYLTNVNTHEIIGQSMDLTVPEANKALTDRSDATKTLKYIRKCFLSQDGKNKYNKVGYALRRLSVDSLSSMIFKVLNRMMTVNAMNWCGHEYGKDVKDVAGMELRSRPENLIVLLNNEDLSDMFKVLGSQVTGPFTETSDIRGMLSYFTSMGVRFYGVNYILPSMAIVVDKIAFRFVEYFNESYSRFHEYDLIDATVHHMFKKPVLYRKVACNVIEPADGQKFALPLGWASEHLPYIREAS